MSRQLVKSELLIDLSDEQQELVAGGLAAPGLNFELSNSIYNANLANISGLTTAGPLGSNSYSTGNVSNLANAGQDFLGLNAAGLPLAFPAFGI